MFHSMFPGFGPCGVVVLAGISGSGKSSWARDALPGTHVLSSDTLRGVLTDDDEHQDCSRDAFDMLEQLADLRLKWGRLAVVDATNLKRGVRSTWLKLARKHKVPAVVVFFDTPPEVCARRQLLRDRRVPLSVLERQAKALDTLLPNLLEEDWDGVGRVHTGVGVNPGAPLHCELLRAYDAPAVVRLPLGGALVQRTHVDVIGDVHGCHDELLELLGKLDYQRGDSGWFHPQGRFVVFVGDLTDRGPASLAVLETARALVDDGCGLAVLGNHDDKLRRWAKGNNVKVAHGLESTVGEFADLPSGELLHRKAQVRGFLESMPMWVLCDPAPGMRAGSYQAGLAVAHAAWKPSLLRAAKGKMRSWCLYGPNTGNNVDGLPQRLDWKPEYPADGPFCVVGHTAFDGPVVERNNTMCIDTGCVFGGKLSAVRWPEREIVQVPARRTYYDKPLERAPRLWDPAEVGLRQDKAPEPEAAPVQVGPARRFDLLMPNLLGRLHADPGAVLTAVHQDPKLLKRSCRDIVLANASKLLFTPEEAHQIYAKGIIYRTEPWEVVSLPYLKMYNYGEREDAYVLANSLAQRADVTVRFNEKLDGSMVQTFAYAGAVIVTTRGMMDGVVLEGITGFNYLAAARSILERQSPLALDAAVVEGRTFLWELIHPEARIVTDYGGREDLVLTGVVDFRSGVPFYVDRAGLEATGVELGVPVAPEMSIEGEALAARLESLAARLDGTDQEGAVLTFEGPDDGGRHVVLHRVKVKGASYLRLMRLFAYCTYDRTREYLEANPDITSWEGFKSFLETQGADAVPEEVLSGYRMHYGVWAEYQASSGRLAAGGRALLAAWSQREAPVPDVADREAYKAWRKALAAWVMATCKPLGWLVFAAVDDRLDAAFVHRKFRGDAEACLEAVTALDAISEAYAQRTP
jgi:predicted kinase